MIERNVARDLPPILGDLAAGPYPDYLDDVFALTADRRQRPAWTFPGRWLPEGLRTTPAPFAGLSWRTVGVLAVLATLLAISIGLLVAGSARPAPLYGTAANGLVASSDGGDIATIDPATGAATAIVTGPQWDGYPAFSRDGTWIVFLRQTGPDAVDTGRLMVVRPDGRDLTEVTPVDLVGLEWFEISPDDRTVAVQSLVDGRRSISLAAMDGSGMRTIVDDVATGSSLSFRPPDGRQILYIRHGPPAGDTLAAVDVVTGDVRTILGFAPLIRPWNSAAFGPDGSVIAYSRLDDRSGTSEVHVVGADGTGDRVVGADGSRVVQWPQWSPSGRLLLVERGDGQTHLPVVVRVDGSAPDVVIQTTVSDQGTGKEWAPDERAILAAPTHADGTAGSHELWDVGTGTVAPGTVDLHDLAGMAAGRPVSTGSSRSRRTWNHPG